MPNIQFRLRREDELKKQDKPTILRGWPKFFVFLFFAAFIIQLILLIILNWGL